MIKNILSYITPFVPTTLFFVIGFILTFESNSLLLFPFLIIIAIFSSYVFNFVFNTICKTDFFSNISKTGNNNYNTVILIGYFSYLYLWWFFLNVKNGFIHLYSIENFLIIFLAGICSVVMLDRNFGFCIGNIGNWNKNLLNDPNFKNPYFYFFILVIFRLSGSFTPNFNVSINTAGSINSNGDWHDRTVVISIPNIEIDEFVNDVFTGGLKNIGDLISNGIIANTSSEKLNAHTLSRFEPSKINISNSSANTPNNEFEEIVKSFLWIPRNNPFLYITLPTKEPEPLWDTAERYGLKTGLVNYNVRQKYTQSGYSIYEKSISSGTGIGNILGNIIEQNAADLLFVNLDEGDAADGSQADKLKNYDRIIGEIQSKAKNYYANYLCIFKDKENESLFFIFSGRKFTSAQKMIDIRSDRIDSDILYSLGIPFIDTDNLGIDSALFKPEYIFMNPPQNTDYHPAYKIIF